MTIDWLIQKRSALVTLRRNLIRQPDAGPDWDPEALLSVLPQGDTYILQEVGLRPVKLVSLPVGDLMQQYVHETAYDHLLCDGSGRVNRSILNSPHYKALVVYKQYGMRELQRQFKTLDFYRMCQHWNTIGFKPNLMTGEKIPIQKTDEDIWAKLLALVNIYEKLRKFGYARGKFRGQYITVLEVPFEVSRYGRQLDCFHEIWGGHHRAASLAALDIREAAVVLLEDLHARKDIAS